ncbi:alpha/beta hydrolase family esterase [Fuscibacter oryzae]|uniref:Polyhydroxybutyrate depolymerase n=1 Tax=Fuscibacter oryzae TaxID=2803939 RepID=A0A8J7STF8_9RHOB|nr:PHB depolymerase family esterase [Fuscibacter oryzae]MBL4927467.1 hypothetical protein [Fuscibacter oryzae]
MRLTVLLLLLWLPVSAHAQPLQEVTLPDGRYYLFARPDGDAAVPLIVALHGGGGNPAQFDRVSYIAQSAVAAGFAVALPAGTGGRAGKLKTWNAGYCCAAAQRERVDDIAFLDAVIADAQEHGASGPVFLTGMSNGAMMAQTYAARRANRVAGVASVSGTMDAGHLRVGGPVPLLHIHGTADPMVPFGGGPGDSSLTQTDFSPVEAVLADFRAPFGAMEMGHKSWTADGYDFLRTAWSKGGHEEVVLIAIEGGDHEWPGGRRAEDQALDASDTVIAFFKAQMR